MKIKALTLLTTVALSLTAVLPASFAQEGDDTDFDRLPVRIEVRGRTGDAVTDLRHRDRPVHNPERIFERLDSDGDGWISEDEFVDARLDRSDRAFDRRDTNDDGLISREEAQRRRHTQHPDIDRQAVIKCVRRIVANYDGTPDLEDRFDHVDLNGDGYIDLYELSVAMEERAYVLFDRLDTNNNGYISLQELEEALKKQINLRRVIRYCIKQVSDPFEAEI